jgi:hypothetical protein
MPVLERPLRLGELVEATTQIYRDRIGAAFALGVFVAGALLVGIGTGHPIPILAIFALTFTAADAVAARIAAGDSLREACALTAARAVPLLLLTVVVSVPFAISRFDPIFFLFAIAWLAATGFSIPVLMLEDGPSENWFARVGHSLQRSVALARAEFFHALGVVAALVLIYVLVGTLIAGALVGFAENGGLAATLLVQVVLAPFFFLGLAVLYFDQKARAVSSRGTKARGRTDADVHHAVEAERAGAADTAREPGPDS